MLPHRQLPIAQLFFSAMLLYQLPASCSCSLHASLACFEPTLLTVFSHTAHLTSERNTAAQSSPGSPPSPCRTCRAALYVSLSANKCLLPAPPRRGLPPTQHTKQSVPPRHGMYLLLRCLNLPQCREVRHQALTLTSQPSPVSCIPCNLTLSVGMMLAGWGRQAKPCLRMTGEGTQRYAPSHASLSERARACCMLQP